MIKFILTASNIASYAVMWIAALIEIKRLIHCMYVTDNKTALSRSKGQSDEIGYLILDSLIHIVIWLMIIAVRVGR